MSSESSPISNISPSTSIDKLPLQLPNPTSSSSPTLNAFDVEDTLTPSLEDEEDIEKQEGEKKVKSSDAHTLHTWDGPTDPEHPTNWPLWKKLCTTVMLAAVTFTISLNSAMFEPATEQVVKEFKGTPKEVTLLGTSLYLLVPPPQALSFSFFFHFLLANFRAGVLPRSSLLGSAV